VSQLRCPECKSEIPENLLLCPQCGRSIEDTHPVEAQRCKEKLASLESTTELHPLVREVLDATKPKKVAMLRTYAVWGFAVLLAIALTMGTAVLAGVFQGERDRKQRRIESAEAHYQSGLERLEDGHFELAIAEFEYALELNPDHSFASQGVSEAQTRKATIPTPTTEVYEIVAQDLLLQGREHFEAERWQDAVSVLTQLRSLDSTIEPDEVEDMLFQSLYRAGIQLLDQDELEQGIFYLDQAVALRPLDQDAVQQRSLAVSYMTALGYWAVDWEVCIERFEQLYSQEPSYKDTFRRLYEAHVQYGDASVSQGEMCPAEEQYTLAMQLVNGSQLADKLAEAADACALATPTPIAPIEGTSVVTLTQTPPGFTVGRLAYPVLNSDTGLYDIYALYAQGYLIKMTDGADQPSWVGRGESLVVRGRATPGIWLIAPGAQEPTQIAADARISWPTVSPDGQRIAYAVPDTAGEWQIYIGSVDGSGEPVIHASGKGPTWGPTGLLAWTGCDDSNACGIFVDNPDDDQPAQRLTASYNDVGLSWSPSGSQLAYMSNASGDWEVYLVGLGGGVVLVTDDPASDGLPAWSPDGSRIAFVSNRDGSWAIYLMEPSGQNPAKILALGPNLPDWTSQRLSWAP
jgi:Tol biopolymer transport system component/tetratricopeptide (TPR) repeat protein